MRKCSECKHFLEFNNYPPLCKLKSSYSIVTQNRVSFNESKVTTCLDERINSIGLFGLFKDKTRCGKDGRNFEEKQ